MDQYECNTHKWTGQGMELSCPKCATAKRLPQGYYQRSDGTVVNRYGKPVSDKRLKEVTEMRAGSNRQADETIQRVKARDLYTCKHCGTATRNGQVDHVTALINGGSNEDSNLQYLCKDCHAIKTSKDMGHKVKYGANLDGTPKDKGHHWNED